MTREEFNKLTQDFSGEELARAIEICNEEAAKGQPMEPEQAIMAVILNRGSRPGAQPATADQLEGARMLNEAFESEKKKNEERAKSVEQARKELDEINARAKKRAGDKEIKSTKSDIPTRAIY